MSVGATVAGAAATGRAAFPPLRGGRTARNHRVPARRYINAQTRMRLYVLVHIAKVRLSLLPEAELYNIDFARGDAAAIAKYGIEPPKRPIQACEEACHIGNL